MHRIARSKSRSFKGRKSTCVDREGVHYDSILFEMRLAMVRKTQLMHTDRETGDMA